MGAMCCVAARPQVSAAGSRDWSSLAAAGAGTGDEPLWHTNFSFSPPLSNRWEYNNSDVLSVDHFQPSSFHSSLSSYVGSPSDAHRYPPTEYGAETSAFRHVSEGGSRVIYSAGSTSSRSDGSEIDLMAKVPISFVRSSRYFMSKPIHPLPFVDDSPEHEVGHCIGTPDSSNSLQFDVKTIRELTELQSSGNSNLSISRREVTQCSNSSSIDLSDFPEKLRLDWSGLSCRNQAEAPKCGLCERLLSQRSPWGSRRIIRSGDMPITGVLSCWHVYHVECLEHTTPRAQMHDPPCPLCNKCESTPEQWAISRLRNGIPRLRPVGAERPSRVWTCTQAGDCLEGAVEGHRRNHMLLLTHSPLKRHLTFKGNSSKDQAQKPRIGRTSPQLFDGRVVGDLSIASSSRNLSNSALKKW